MHDKHENLGIISISITYGSNDLSENFKKMKTITQTKPNQFTKLLVCITCISLVYWDNILKVLEESFTAFVLNEIWRTAILIHSTFVRKSSIILSKMAVSEETAKYVRIIFDAR